MILIGSLIGLTTALAFAAILAVIDCYKTRKGDNNDRKGK